MVFPEEAHVAYEQNPLQEVTCQLRFPAILRVAAEPPAKFQELLRSDYEHYEEGPKPAVPLPDGPVGDRVKAIMQSLAAEGRFQGEHKFWSGDQRWSVVLTRDFVALQTTDYRSWTEFRPRMERVLDAFVSTYRPSYYTRVGLRYIDVIERSTLGVSDRPWSELLSPHITGELGADDLKDRIRHAARQVRIQLNDDGDQVMIRHGLVVGRVPTDPAFMVDSDFYTENRMETGSVLTKLDGYNQEAWRLFRWCIRPTLHNALRPLAD